MHLRRSISMPGLLFAAIAGIMGSGWLFGPFFAAKVAGPAAILSWVLGGGLMILIAITFAELATAFPVAGGSVRFLHFSHGPLVSFTMAWIAWLSSSAVAPIETLAMLQYASSYYPGLTHMVGGVSVLTKIGFTVAAFLMMFMCIVNYFGIRFLSKANSIIVFFKLAVPITTIIFLITHVFHFNNITAIGFAPMGLKGILAALPTAGVIFSFIGYSPAIQLAGETKNPQRAIPFAIIGALLIAITIYVLLQIAFIEAVKPEDFQNGWNNLMLSEGGPFVAIATSLGAVWMVWVIMSGATIAPFGTALIYTASASRIAYAMGENGYVPKSLQLLNRFGVPAKMIAINYVVGLLLFLPFPSWQQMVSFLVGAFVFSYGVGPLALIVLRKTMPLHPRPFKVPCARLTCFLAFYVCNLIIFWTGWMIVSKMMLAIILGYGFLAIFKLSAQGRSLNLEWKSAWWIFPYIFVMTLLSYCGSFGGGQNYLPFGWDFLVIAIVTLLVFESAARSGVTHYEAHGHS
jgi:amino acid transporter